MKVWKRIAGSDERLEIEELCKWFNKGWHKTKQSLAKVRERSVPNVERLSFSNSNEKIENVVGDGESSEKIGAHELGDQSRRSFSTVEELPRRPASMVLREYKELPSQQEYKVLTETEELLAPRASTLHHAKRMSLVELQKNQVLNTVRAQATMAQIPMQIPASHNGWLVRQRLSVQGWLFSSDSPPKMSSQYSMSPALKMSLERLATPKSMHPLHRPKSAPSLPRSASRHLSQGPLGRSIRSGSTFPRVQSTQARTVMHMRDHGLHVL
uniref:Uncharacterized protein n=1 Tax=Haptolina brevifila TaxID=156173 RepID=A0A7S2GZ88_9EUKA